MEFDEILEKYVGQFGRFQLVMLLFIGIEEFFIAIHTMSPVFLAMKQDHHCQIPMINNTNCTQEELVDLYIPHDASGSLSSCSRYEWNHTQWDLNFFCTEEYNKTSPDNLYQSVPQVKCESWTHDNSIYKNTIVTEWDLVCERQYLASSLSSVFMAGRLVGSIVFGLLSDWVGRKPVVVGAGFVYVLAGVAMALVPSFDAVLAMRFIMAFCGTGKTMAALVMVTEFVGPDWRVFTMTVYYFYWIGGYTALSLIAYLIQDWRTLELVISAPEGLFFIAFIFLVPESPRWLLSKNKKKLADAVLHKMARWNQTEYPDDIEKEVTKKKLGTMWDLVGTPGLRKVSLIVALSWLTNGFVYFGLSLNSSNLAGNPYLNSLVSGAVEVPAYFLVLLLLKYFGRVYTYVVWMVMSGVSLVCITPVPPGFSMLTIVFSMIGKFCITCSWQVMIFYSTEIFPTDIRGIGINCSSAFARIGAILGAYTDLLAAIHHSLQFIVFGAAATMVGVFALALPETQSAPLTQSVCQAERFIQEHPGRCCCCCQHTRNENNDLPLKEALKDKRVDDSICA